MSRGYKKKSWKQVVIAVWFIITLMVVCTAVYANYEKEKCLKKIIVLEEQINAYQRLVYVASEKLTKGSVLTKEKLRQEIRYSDRPQEVYITENFIGMQLEQDVEEGTSITVSMLCQTKQDMREVFVEEIELPEHVQTGDRVDVRIRYSNAEDYIVLSDKNLLMCKTGVGIVLELTEEEILLLSSALFDCERYEHTKLYVVEYPEYEQVSSGCVTYVANMEILMLLEREKTEGESRNALEQRLMQHKQ